MDETTVTPIAGIDDPSKARVMLYQAGRPVHAPLDQVGLLTPDAIDDMLTEAEAAAIYLTTASAASTYLTTASAASTYLTSATAAATYHPVSELTDWVAYTPTFTGFGTVSSTEIKSKRIGDSLYIRGHWTSGTPTAVEARMTLGSNGSNANVTAATLNARQLSGTVIRNLSGAASYYALIESGAGYITFGAQSAGTNGLAKINADILSGTGTLFSLFAVIPISGW